MSDVRLSFMFVYIKLFTCLACSVVISFDIIRSFTSQRGRVEGFKEFPSIDLLFPATLTQKIGDDRMIVRRITDIFDPISRWGQFVYLLYGKGFKRKFDVIHKRAIALDDVFPISRNCGKKEI